MYFNANNKIIQIDIIVKNILFLSFLGSAFFSTSPKVEYFNGHSVEKLFRNVWFSNQEVSFNKSVKFNTIKFKNDVEIQVCFQKKIISMRHVNKTIFRDM